MNKRKRPTEVYGGFILTFEPARSELMDAALRYQRQEATETFSSKDWKFERRELVLISTRLGEEVGDVGTLDGAALMERSRVGGATGKLKMRLHTPVMFSEPVSVEELPSPVRTRISFSTSLDMKRIVGSDWEELLGCISRLRPKHARSLSVLVLARTEERRILPSDIRTERLFEQRDAVGLALDIGQLDRRRILGKLDSAKLSKAKSALDLLDSQPVHEQDVLRHDSVAFGSLFKIGMRHVRFANRSGAEVRVHIYDKKRLEDLLGIDLLLYLEPFDSYILIQYKMMRKGSGGERTCSVDAQLRKQLASMARTVKALNLSSDGPIPIREWRLAEDMFFWKFCEATRPSDTESELAHGMTLPYRHLVDFLELKESEGPSGGRSVGYSNCPRYFNNSQFIELAQSGWIGGGKRARLMMERVLKANASRNRQTILASIEDTRPAQSSRRGWKMLE